MSLISNEHGFPSDLIYNQYIQYGTAGNALNRVEYLGYAAPGSATTDEVWLIKKLFYDASGRFLYQQFANGQHEFNQAFVTPENYSYS